MHFFFFTASEKSLSELQRFSSYIFLWKIYRYLYLSLESILPWFDLLPFFLKRLLSMMKIAQCCEFISSISILFHWSASLCKSVHHFLISGIFTSLQIRIFKFSKFVLFKKIAFTILGHLNFCISLRISLPISLQACRCFSLWLPWICRSICRQMTNYQYWGLPTMPVISVYKYSVDFSRGLVLSLLHLF